MLVNVHHDSPAEHRRLLVAGVAFLTVIALLVYLSIAIYQKKFESVTMVTIKADRAGLQLAEFGDVRLHGALVGQVRAVEQDGDQASIRVALRPDAAREIPADTEVEILPTTLFGQKFVSFVTDDGARSGDGLDDGDVIPADRVETNVELSRILADLFPLLRAVQPADLNLTLNALATALGGRGEQLGETLERLDGYLDEIDDHLPTLRKDLVALAEVADTYDLAAPDLVGVLDNLTVTGKTILAKQRELDVFFSDVAGLATTTTRVLTDNEQNLIRVGEVTEPVLRLLATYSPQLPCLIKGAARYAPRLARTFEGNRIKQYIEFGTPQYRAYDERDLPEYGEVGHGPWCLGLPDPPVPVPPVSFDDGTDLDDNPPTSPLPNFGLFDPPGTRKQAADPTSGFAGTEGDRRIIAALLADRTGRAADTYGTWGSLLYGPVVRGGGGS
ncbi:MCE family protein [Nocardioides sp. SYSU D00038]|uniref:MCE family protein n=1 Tax=Nocardioides sp. SYSU D00038 TaxID=2812554 RepID=UPI0019686430|nr:MCE family protein [Nocardioides sp. SYSU D00038]